MKGFGIRTKFKRKYYEYHLRKKAKHLGSMAKINAKTIVNSNTYIGNNFNSNGLCIIGRGKVKVGDNFHCGFGCILITENHRYKNATRLPYDREYDVRSISIGSNVWLGINVTILPGVNIGEGAIIQAGSVVVKDVGALEIVGGNPAKVFSRRDECHYNILKEQHLYH